ncbi:DUF2802 domain-containing protein [Uliginosibacterium sp. TH139]|uniref:DUF2802 domain-containing protein n=1 Tax=Uliginosibacterium sp. TH139 TaxID=2067453 RepID=UPI0020B138F4|nr:DUF2802 domain-containing protein [Uliginosibacterium sp. TH139]
MTFREIVLWLVGGLAAYLVWLCVRLLRLRKPRTLAPTFSEEATPPETIHSQILGGDPELSFSSVHFDGSRPANTFETDAGIPRTEPRLNRLGEPDATEFGFDALLEMRQTRHLLDELRLSHDQLQAQVKTLQDELHALRAACQVSPMYSEAVALAQRGYDVDAIAERCGISIAEAQLVRSLSSDAKGEQGNDRA